MSDSIFTDDELAADAVRENTPEAEVVAASQPVDNSMVNSADEPEVVETEPADPAPNGDTPADVQPPKGFVPHAALHAERMRVRELQAREAARDARMAQIEAMFAPQPVEIDQNEDPVGAIRQDVGAVINRLDRQDAEQRDQQLRNFVQQDLAQFRTAKPDFDAAADHVIASRAEELRLYGYSDADIHAAIVQDDRAIVEQAARTGTSVAQTIYDIARVRGYNPTPAPVPAIANANGAANKVAAINNGQARNRSLGSAPGSAPASELSIRALLDMDEDEFAKIPANQFRKVAGG